MIEQRIEQDQLRNRVVTGYLESTGLFWLAAVDANGRIDRAFSEPMSAEGYKRMAQFVTALARRRSAEVDLLLGDPTKAEKTFGWKAKVDVRGLAQMMAKSDFDALG